MDDWQAYHNNAWYQWNCAHPEVPPGGLRALSEAEREKLHHDVDGFRVTSYFGTESPDYQFFPTLDRSLRHLGTKTDIHGRRVVIMPISKSEMAKRPPTVGLGILDSLPLEVLNVVISVLDIAAMSRFKAVNRRAFQVVNAHPQVQLLIWQAQEVLRGFFAVKLAATVTVETLVARLAESRCVECGDFGGYMYLLTLERFCAWCAQKTDRIVAVQELVALARFGLTPEALRSIPRFEKFPAPTHHEPDEGKYLPLFDRESVLKAAIARHGSEEAMSEFARRIEPHILQSYKNDIEERERKHDEARFRKRRARKVRYRAYTRARVAQKKAERERRKREVKANQESGISLNETDHDSSTDPNTDAWSELEAEEDALPKALQKAEEERELSTSCQDPHISQSLRCAALLRVPWLNTKRRIAEWGFHCVGCLHRRWLHTAVPRDNDKQTYFRRDFLVSTFEGHLEEFGPIRDDGHHTRRCCEQGICNKRAHCHCKVCRPNERIMIEYRNYWAA
ncbi:hypothetical protein F5883DRAFT_582836 [Diaporthe sp. PMI_573]|nr:hypothetical protein F5883DRAFT_582836 [Diaporthaceae sp. PMI_573]